MHSLTVNKQISQNASLIDPSIWRLFLEIWENKKKMKPLELSVEKQETLLCKMAELKRNQFFWISTLNHWWQKNIIQVVTNTMPNPMSKNNTDNLSQHLIK